MARKRRELPTWRWRFLKYDGATNKSSQPRVLDDKGQVVRLTRERDCKIAAIAPDLLRSLGLLADDVRFLNRWLRVEYPGMADRPSFRALDALYIRARMEGLLP